MSPIVKVSRYLGVCGAPFRAVSPPPPLHLWEILDLCTSLILVFHQCHVDLLPAATKLGQGNIFTSVCQEFCPRGGGCLPQCMLGYTPPEQADHPPWTRHTTPPGTRPPGPGTPSPQEQTPPEQTPPRPGTPPPLGADTPPPRADTPPRSDCSIRSMSGRYASYWNAFLF